MPLTGDAHIRTLDAAERRREAVRLRREGATWDEVADQVGYASRGAAYTEVERAMKAGLAEMFTETELYRYESLERLRELIKALWPRRQDEKVAAEIRRITERMDKLTGAERPIQFEIGESDVDRALRGIDEEHRRRFGEAARETGPT
jgi:hypothetical protein